MSSWSQLAAGLRCPRPHRGSKCSAITSLPAPYGHMQRPAREPASGPALWIEPLPSSWLPCKAASSVVAPFAATNSSELVHPTLVAATAACLQPASRVPPATEHARGTWTAARRVSSPRRHRHP